MKQLHEKKKGTSPVYRKVAIVSIQLRIILNIIGTLVAVTFGYFIGSEGTAQITTGKNILLLGITLLCLIYLFRLYCVSLINKYGFRVVFNILYILHSEAIVDPSASELAESN